jgi:hypothetical protein
MAGEQVATRFIERDHGRSRFESGRRGGCSLVLSSSVLPAPQHGTCLAKSVARPRSPEEEHLEEQERLLAELTEQLTRKGGRVRLARRRLRTLSGIPTPLVSRLSMLSSTGSRRRSCASSPRARRPGGQRPGRQRSKRRKRKPRGEAGRKRGLPGDARRPIAHRFRPSSQTHGRRRASCSIFVNLELDRAVLAGILGQLPICREVTGDGPYERFATERAGRCDAPGPGSDGRCCPNGRAR